MSGKHFVSVQGRVVNHSTSFQNPHRSSAAPFPAVITQVPLCCLGDGVSDYGLLCPNSEFFFTTILILFTPRNGDDVEGNFNLWISGPQSLRVSIY